MNSISQMTLFNPGETCFISGDVVKTTSVRIAEVFGKRHDHVLRKIQAMDIDEFSRPNFGEAFYIDAQGKKRPMYEITKDGFMFVVMGFTGKKADKIKIAYINTFNKMAEQLCAGNNFQIPQNYPDALRLAADQQDQIIQLETQKAADAPKVEVYDKHLNADGLKPFRLAANDLGMRPVDLRRWMQTKGYIYKHPGNEKWLAYSPYIKQGLFEHKEHIHEGRDGYQKVSSRALITPKGFLKFAQELGHN